MNIALTDQSLEHFDNSCVDWFFYMINGEMKLKYTKNNESNSEFYLISDKNKKNRIPR